MGRTLPRLSGHLLNWRMFNRTNRTRIEPGESTPYIGYDNDKLTSFRAC
ncbi:hypothetical protein [Nonomuraea sp. SYSU D8015]|nr:hypothetical protein [Nonomuraea sp. SYSU D8015]